MDPFLNIATSQSKGDGSFRIVIKNKEPYATFLRSPGKHSPPWKKKELCEKPKSVTRSIQQKQEKKPGESSRERQKGDINRKTLLHVGGARGVGKEITSTII